MPSRLIAAATRRTAVEYISRYAVQIHASSASASATPEGVASPEKKPSRSAPRARSNSARARARVALIFLRRNSKYLSRAPVLQTVRLPHAVMDG